MYRCYTCRQRSLTDRSPPLKQLRLGCSQDKQLCILPPYTSQSPRKYSHSIAASQKDGPLISHFITKIPDELLNDIFTHAVQNQVGQTGVFHTALALCKVSRDFHRIVQPLLYRSLNLSHHSLARPCLAVRLLHRSLKENLILGHIITTLHVRVECLVSHPTFPGAFAIGIEILSLVPNVEVFQIQGGYEYSSTWPMIQNAVRNWKQIRHVRLFRQVSSLFMPPVFELVIATPSLTTLELHGVTEEMESTPRAVWSQLSKEIERTSAITTLTIHDFSSTPSALQTLLLLPKALSHFTFGTSPVTWTLTQFQTFLAPHQETLTHIEIGSFGLGYTPINFRSFPRLEVLQLSHWVYRATPEEAASSLLAPRLNTFIWNFRAIGQSNACLGAFSTPQKEWLLRFAELASERKSSLRRIEILFFSDGELGLRTSEELAVCITLWDLMDKAREEIGELGIELIYDKCWSREECLEALIKEEKLEKFRDEGLESEDEISLLSVNEEN